MRIRQARGKTTGASLIAVVLALGLGACGGGDESSGTTAAAEKSEGGSIIYRPKYRDDKVTVGSMRSPEQRLLGEIYALTLEAAGFEISRYFELASAREAREALEEGRITGFPYYASDALALFFGYGPKRVPSGADAVFNLMDEKMAKRGLNGVGPTAATRANAVAVLKSVAEAQELQAISDLRRIAPRMAVVGPPACDDQADCLPALERRYGLKFRSFQPVANDLRYTALDDGQAELSIVSTIDPELWAEKGRYVILEDDRSAFPASGVAWVSDEAATTRWFPDFTKWTTLVSGGLTLPIFQELKARVELEGESPQDVAASFLESAGYVE